MPSRGRVLARWLRLAPIVLAAACTTTVEPLRGPLAPSMLPGWHADSLSGLDDAIRAQCALPRPPAPWTALCVEFAAIDEGTPATSASRLRAWLEQRFRAWPLHDTPKTGLLTGYFEPVVTGSLARERREQVPLYGVPPDLVGGTVYRSRAQIERDGAPGAPVIAWLDDPIDAFFLHVQGSGRVVARDGRVLRVGFAAHNGHAYRAIGRVLVARGALTPAQADAPGIRNWLVGHPDEAAAVMAENPRYIFFRLLGTGDADAGPPGSLGVALTPMRSLATDPAHVPGGALVYLDAGAAPLRRLGVSQDTGAAIVGAPRADLFTGRGPDAGALAGRLRERTNFWLLWPRDLPRPDPTTTRLPRAKPS